MFSPLDIQDGRHAVEQWACNNRKGALGGTSFELPQLHEISEAMVSSQSREYMRGILQEGVRAEKANLTTTGAWGPCAGAITVYS